MPQKLHSEFLQVTDGAVASSEGDAGLSLFRVFTVDSYKDVSLAQLSLPFSTRPHGTSLLYEATERKLCLYSSFREWSYMAQRHLSTSTST